MNIKTKLKICSFLLFIVGCILGGMFAHANGWPVVSYLFVCPICGLLANVFMFLSALSEVDLSNTYSRGRYNKVKFDTDEITGRTIAEAEKLSGKSVSYSDAQDYATYYNTDLGKGAMLASLENLNKQAENKNENK